MKRARVKICGITRSQDAEAAVHAGADAIGLVFYGPSQRNIEDLGLADEIARAAGPFATVTALFVDADAAEIEKVLGKVAIKLLQFHGKETAAFCSQFDRPWIKALRVRDQASLGAQFNQFPDAVGLLLDTYVKGVPGGTGEAFNWNLVPETRNQAIVVAGGLNPENVGAAIKQTRPYGVDVSGGVESAPGIKSPQLIERFINNAKGIGENLE